MAVEVLASPVVAHRGPRIGMPGGDLDISQVHARVEPVESNVPTMSNA